MNAPVHSREASFQRSPSLFRSFDTCFQAKRCRCKSFEALEPDDVRLSVQLRLYHKLRGAVKCLICIHASFKIVSSFHHSGLWSGPCVSLHKGASARRRPCTRCKKTALLLSTAWQEHTAPRPCCCNGSVEAHQGGGISQGYVTKTPTS